MPGDFTCTSAISGAATNTVAAGPGSLSAVPLLISRLRVGCCVGTTWLCAKLRLGAPVMAGDGGAAGVACAGACGTGRIGTGAGDCAGGWSCAC